MFFWWKGDIKVVVKNELGFRDKGVLSKKWTSGVIFFMAHQWELGVEGCQGIVTVQLGGASRPVGATCSAFPPF